jgi:hypothetical protein
VASDAGALGKKLKGLSQTTKVASEKSVREGARIIQGNALAAIAEVTHGSMTLRGVRARSTGKEAKLGVTAKVIGTGSDTTAIVHATGPWQFVERAVSPHAVGIRLEEAGQQPVMLVPGGSGFATGPWIAGGSPGKHPFKLAAQKSKPQVTRLYDEAVAKHIRSNF